MQASAPSASFFTCHVHAHCSGTITQTCSGDFAVEYLNMRQQNGVTYTVWQVVETAQLVRHRMNITQRSIIERHTGEELGISHCFTRFRITAIFNG